MPSVPKLATAGVTLLLFLSLNTCIYNTLSCFAISTCPIHFILLHSLYWLDWKSICSFYGLCAVSLMKNGAKSWNSFHATFFPPLLIWLRNGRATKNCLHAPPQRVLYSIEPQFTISVIDRASRTTKKEPRTRQSCSHNSVEMKLHAPVRFIFIYRLHHNSKLHWQDRHALQVAYFTCSQHATSAMLTKTSKHASEPFQKYVDVTGSYRHNPDNLATFKTEWQKRVIEESLLTREKANAQPWLRTNESE